MSFESCPPTPPHTHPFRQHTNTHIQLFLAGSVTVPHLQSYPGRDIRPFPLMKLSAELSASHSSVLLASILLSPIVLLTFSSSSTLLGCPLCSSFFFTTHPRFTPLPYLFLHVLTSCSSPSYLPLNGAYEKRSTTYNNAEIWSAWMDVISTKPHPFEYISAFPDFSSRHNTLQSQEVAPWVLKDSYKLSSVRMLVVKQAIKSFVMS